MILKAKVEYTNEYGTLLPGATTAKWKGITEERLKKMLVDFPEWFEVVEESKPETRTESFEIETPEAKMPKTRKK